MGHVYVYLVTSIRLALLALRRHASRSFLTLLGILIGIATVVTIGSLGRTLRDFFNSQITTQATADMLFIMPDTMIKLGRWQPANKPFRNRDLEAVRRSEFIATAIGGNFKYDALIKHGWRSLNGLMIAAPHEYMPLNNMSLARGRVFSVVEERAAARVAVIGPKVVSELFRADEAPLGSALLIEGVRFTIIGILESRSALENGQEVNSGVFIPLQTCQQRLFGKDEVFWIMAKVRDTRELAQAKDDVSRLLRQSRQIRHGAEMDFQVTTMEDWARFANTYIDALILVFIIVAVISLTVGSIGVMNIMLVSVRERTREIGLRMALGATPGEIAWQFLIESFTLTVSGGIAGAALGWAIGAGVLAICRHLWGISMEPQLPLPWLIAALAACGLIGLAAGMLPALKAARMDPVRAMHYE